MENVGVFHIVRLGFKLEDEVLQIAREAINWNTYKIVQSEVEKLTPELQNQIQDILHTATILQIVIN